MDRCRSGTGLSWGADRAAAVRWQGQDFRPDGGDVAEGHQVFQEGLAEEDKVAEPAPAEPSKSIDQTAATQAQPQAATTAQPQKAELIRRRRLRPPRCRPPAIPLKLPASPGMASPHTARSSSGRHAPAGARPLPCSTSI